VARHGVFIRRGACTVAAATAVLVTRVGIFRVLTCAVAARGGLTGVGRIVEVRGVLTIGGLVGVRAVRGVVTVDRLIGVVAIGDCVTVDGFGDVADVSGGTAVIVFARNHADAGEKHHECG
jgi:hypothetical protein